MKIISLRLVWLKRSKIPCIGLGKSYYSILCIPVHHKFVINYTTLIRIHWHIPTLRIYAYNEKLDIPVYLV